MLPLRRPAAPGLLVALLVSLGPFAAGLGDAYLASLQDGDCATGADAANDAEGATPLVPPSECSGALLPTDRSDWYSFAVLAGQVVDLAVSEERGGTNYQVRLLTPWGIDTGTTHYPAPIFENGFRWNFIAQASATLKVGILGRGYLVEDPAGPDPGKAVPYRLRLAVTDPDPGVADDCGSGRDASSAAPVPLAFPFTCLASFPRDQSDPADAYTVEGLAGQRVRIHFAPDAGTYPMVCLRAPSGWAECDHPTLQPPRPEVTVEGVLPETGTWRIEVTGAFRPTSTSLFYTLSGTAEMVGLKPAEDDCGLGRDAADHETGAEPIQPGTCAGSMTEFLDGIDWYALEAQWGDALRLRLHFDDGWGTFVLLSPTGQWILPSWGQGACVVVDEPGTWRIGVSRYSFWADYRLETQLLRALPALPGPDAPLTGWPNPCDYNPYTRGIVQVHELG